MERGGIVRSVALICVALLMVTGVAVYAALVLPPINRPKSTPNASGNARSIDLPTPASAAPVLQPLARKPVSLLRLKQHLASVLAAPALGHHLGFAVAELGSDRLVWQQGTPPSVTPASTMKLLTTTAALDTLGPERRFITSVVSGATKGQIVLVGGGDPLLTTTNPTPAEARVLYPAPATLQQLAQQTAANLKSQRVRRVRVGYDASLFSGPAVNPAWEPAYIKESVVSPISALWVDEGRASKSSDERVGDPARFAAAKFVEQLTARGITVVGPPAQALAPSTAHRLAAVSSAPLTQIVAQVLEASDNEGAEVLLRQIALQAGGSGSSADGVTVMESALRGLGVHLQGARIYDGSGLSRHDLLPVQALIDVLEISARSTRPGLRTVIASLPVAGFSGTLSYRFVADSPGGVGVVRAKTGTLTGVHGLAGVVTTRAGQGLVFAAVADRVAVSQTLGARADLDKIATTLSTCGC